MIKHHIEGVKKVILVSSGKGGVGKSTMSVFLAELLQSHGAKVGIVDADIYGPSIPTMLGVESQKPELENKKFIPIFHRNFQLMSIGFLVPEAGPIAWRGPMATKAIYQLLGATKWENLDYLIIDMPPGTGDIHLAILENYNIDNVYIVTIPQAISMIDVERAIGLYQKFGIEISGIIENMSSENFPGDAGEILSKKYGIKLMGKVPPIKEVSYNIDHGLPILNLLSRFIKYC
ncbi:MAG UNVERIFIED_CONTAM: Mrp/NBP35 family ATP-binding protein [Rickettsiaceae bacterium]|jgi:ATP-binding protein involved in chromosome partitioning